MGDLKFFDSKLTLFKDVSDPTSPNYGKYLTIDDITNLVAPSNESIQKVNQWLDENGKFFFCIGKLK